jgi:DNA polymerase III alpha subunit
VLCEYITDVGRYSAGRVAGFERHVRQSVRHLAFGPNHEAIATRRSDRSPGGIGNRSSVELSHEIGQANVNPRAGGGAVTHRQRPATAQGVTFINLEDDTGMVNVLCSPGVWARHRRLAQTASALLIRAVRCRTPQVRSPSSPTGLAASTSPSAPAPATSGEYNRA